MASNEEKYLWKGQKFRSYEEFHAALEKREKHGDEKFTIRSTSFLKKNDSDDANGRLIVYERLFECVFGTARESKSTGKKKTKTIKHFCPVSIRIAARKREYLEVTRCDEKHENHEEGKDIIRSTFQGRKLSPELTDEVAQLLRLGCDKNKIRDKLQREHDIYIPRKDLDNLAQRLREKDGDSLDRVIDLLKSYGAKYKIMHTDLNFNGLFFTTKAMNEYVKKFSEIVFVDGTYGLFRLGFTLLLLVVEDAHGKTHIVGVGILADESYDTLKFVFEWFKAHNEGGADNIAIFMTDKDLSSRTAIRKVYPDSKLMLCEFHVKKAISREVAANKMDITQEERHAALDILNRLVQSSSEKQYESLYAKLKEEAPSVVFDYYDKNWHSIKEQWTRFSMFYGNLGNTTNNRLESLNGRVKKWMTLNDLFVPAVTNLLKLIEQQERDFSYEKMQHKIKRDFVQLPPSSDEGKYKSNLSPYAFEKVQKEMTDSKFITLKNVDVKSEEATVTFNDRNLRVTTSTCECPTWMGWLYPCRHIFAVRTYFQLSLFDEKLCNRWKLAQGDTSASQYSAAEFTSSGSSRIVQAVTPKKMTLKQKRDKLKPILNDLLLVASCSQPIFERRLKELEKIRHHYRQNEDVCVMSTHLLQAGSSDEDLLTNVSQKLGDISLESTNMNDPFISEENDSSSIKLIPDPVTAVKDIHLPSPLKLINRSKAATSCTLKIPKRKQNSTMSDPLNEKSEKQILSEIVDMNKVELVINREYILAACDMPSQIDEISERFLHDEVALTVVKKYTEVSAFEKLLQLIDERKGNINGKIRKSKK